VKVSTKNGSASAVTVTLAAQPSSLKPKFSAGCAKGNGAASCTIASVTEKQPASLTASVAVASNATSVASVKLTATAKVTTTAKWTAPAATGTTAVTAASAAASAVPSSSPAETPVNVAGLSGVPLGPIPSLNGVSSELIKAGNAGALFPEITGAPGGSSAPSGQTQPSNGETAPVSGASPVSADSPAYTAQAAGLIALGVAIMLIVTRLAVRRRSRSGGPPS
jgi:hypothetical protein